MLLCTKTHSDMTTVKAPWINTQKETSSKKEFGNTQTKCGYFIVSFFSAAMLFIAYHTLAHIMSL